MSQRADDVVVVSACRTPIGKAGRGAFKAMTPDDLLLAVLEATLQRTGLAPAAVQDIAVGNVQLAGAYAGPARMSMLRAGFPASVPLYTVNRQCSSGLQAVANVAASIRAGSIDVGIAAGVESMSFGGGVANPNAELPPVNYSEVQANALARECLVPMGVTAENVAERYGVTRADQDQMAVESHAKALAAQAQGKFDAEIVPVPVVVAGEDGAERSVRVARDEGPRPGTTLEKLAKLKTVFKPDGSVTAGTSSQVSDGAAAVLLMSRAKARSLGLRPLGALRSYQVVGCKPDEMGVGPAVAIPAALAAAGLAPSQIDVFEINEAFAAQALYCVRKLGLPMEKVNPNGGAIALGHPLACTGARQVATLLHELRRTNQRYGVVSMCIGTGMGAAAVFEAE